MNGRQSWLVVLETSGNQQFIFATNKLREIVGASQLTWQVGVRLPLEEVENLGRPRLFHEDSSHLRKNLLDEKLNAPLGGKTSVEVVYATSGKTMLLAANAKLARQLVERVTRRALEEAPGIDLRGVVVEFNFEKELLEGPIKRAHQELEQLRANVPGPESRFLRLPVAAPCRTSGLPARQLFGKAPELEDRSVVSMRKHKATEDGLERMSQVATRGGEYKLVESLGGIDELEAGAWLAVVHADGNGLGQVFLNFHQYADLPASKPTSDQNRAYIDTLRQFSLALDYCAEEALKSALQKMHERRKAPPVATLPVLPLVLGGDDLTLVCEGRLGVQLAFDYLRAFEEQTGNIQLKEHDASPYGAIVPVIMGKATAAIFARSEQPRAPCVHSAAGVAIVKPHFPFHAAYELAEDLIHSAKKELNDGDKRNALSALDFHVLCDASGADLERIRDQLTREGGKTRLFARPYVLDATACKRFTHRDLQTLKTRIRAVRATELDGRRKLPNHMLHELRDGLFLGREAAEARLKLVQERYKPHDIAQLLVGEDLFWICDEGKFFQTGLIDAMDLAEFWHED
jgi:hypothetical protein